MTGLTRTHTVRQISKRHTPSHTKGSSIGRTQRGPHTAQNPIAPASPTADRSTHTPGRKPPRQPSGAAGATQLSVQTHPCHLSGHDGEVRGHVLVHAVAARRSCQAAGRHSRVSKTRAGAGIAPHSGPPTCRADRFLGGHCMSASRAVSTLDWYQLRCSPTPARRRSARRPRLVRSLGTSGEVSACSGRTAASASVPRRGTGTNRCCFPVHSHLRLDPPRPARARATPFRIWGTAARPDTTRRQAAAP